MFNGEQRIRVYNRCKYDIGVTLLSGQNIVINAGSFQLLTANDIIYIESICAVDKYFSQRMLVPVGDDGKDIELESVGLIPDTSVQVHLSDEEVAAMLKQSIKKIEAWISEIDDPVELHSIYEVAKTLDLPASKLKVLSDKMPDKEFLG